MKLKIAICDDDAAQAGMLSEAVSAWVKGKKRMAEIRTYASGRFVPESAGADFFALEWA